MKEWMEWVAEDITDYEWNVWRKAVAWSIGNSYYYWKSTLPSQYSIQKEEEYVALFRDGKLIGEGWYELVQE